MQTGRPAAGLPAARGDCAVHTRPRQTVRGPVPHAGRAGVRYSRDRGCPAYLDEAAQICAAESPFGRGGVGASTHARAGVEGGPVRGFTMASADYAMHGAGRARPPAYSGPANCCCPHDLWGALIIPKRGAPCAADLNMYIAPVARCAAIAAAPATARGRIFRGGRPGQTSRSESGRSGGFSDSTRSHLLTASLGGCTTCSANAVVFNLFITRCLASIRPFACH